MSECKKKLLPHQYEACLNLRRWFCEENKKEVALVSMPTGSGKTGIDHFKVNAAMSPGGANLLGRARGQALNANDELSEELL